MWNYVKINEKSFNKRGKTMAKSFYHYIVKYRNQTAKDQISQFANDVYHDHSFPKGSTDYHELSSYLELNGHYIENMSLFDELWDLYLSENQ